MKQRVLLMTLTLLILGIGIPIPNLSSEVNATSPIKVGLPCNLRAGNSLSSINQNRTHNNILNLSNKAYDLQENDECADNQVIASISGTIQVTTQNDTEFCKNEDGTYIKNPAINTVIKITRSDGVQVVYYHHSANYTSTVADNYVNAGEVLTTIASEGCSTGPHIHFEVRQESTILTHSQWEFADLSAPQQFALPGDVDGDGDEDLIKMDTAAERVLVWEAKDAKTYYAAEERFNGSAGSNELGHLQYVAADIDNDTKVDLLGIDGGAEKFWVWKNDGSGKFLPSYVYYDAADGNYANYKFFAGHLDKPNNNFVDLIAINPATERAVIWKNNGTTLTQGDQWLNDGHNYTSMSFFVDDMTGDNNVDIVSSDPVENRIIVWKNNGSAFTQGNPWYTGGDGFDGYQFKVGDLNDDQLAEVVAIDLDQEKFVVWVNGGETAKFTSLTAWFDGSNQYANYSHLLADIDGDNRQDIVAIDPQNRHRTIVWRSLASPDRFGNGVEASLEPDFTVAQEAFADMDGNAATINTSLLAVEPNGLKFFHWNKLQNDVKGVEKVFDGEEDFSSYEFRYGDVNNDKVTDIVAIKKIEERFVVFTGNTNGTFNAKVTWYDGPYNYANYEFSVADATGDGAADIVAFDDNDERIIVWKSNPASNTFGNGVEWLNGTNVLNVTTKVGDVNGDGKAEIVGVDTTNRQLFVFKNLGEPTFKRALPWIQNIPVQYMSYKFRLANIDGDAAQEVIAIGQNEIIVWNKTSGADTFDAPTSWGNLNLDFANNDYTLADLNNDGFADLVSLYKTADRITYWESNGVNGFNSTVKSWFRGYY